MDLYFKASHCEVCEKCYAASNNGNTTTNVAPLCIKACTKVSSICIHSNSLKHSQTKLLVDNREVYCNLIGLCLFHRH